MNQYKMTVKHSDLLLYIDLNNGQQRKWEVKVHFVEMCMLGRTCGVTRSDRIRNEHVQQNLQVAPIEEKMTECSLRWYEHEHKRPESSPVRHVEELHVKGIGKRGRAVKTLIVLKKDSMESWILELNMATNKVKWESRTHRADPK